MQVDDRKALLLAVIIAMGGVSNMDDIDTLAYTARVAISGTDKQVRDHLECFRNSLAAKSIGNQPLGPIAIEQIGEESCANLQLQRPTRV